MLMDIEVVKRKTVTRSTRNPGPKVGKDLIDDRREQCDIRSRLIDKLVLASSTRRNGQHQNSAFSVTVTVPSFGIARRAKVHFANLRLACSIRTLAFIQVYHVFTSDICNTKRIIRMPEVLALEQVSWLMCLTCVSRRLVARKADSLLRLCDLTFVVPRSRRSIQESNLFESSCMRIALDIN